jgi:hypothetical protein
MTTLEKYGLLRTRSRKVNLVIQSADETKGSFINVFGVASIPAKMEKILEKIRIGMATGLKPDLTFDGTAGTYFMYD